GRGGIRRRGPQIFEGARAKKRDHQQRRAEQHTGPGQDIAGEDAKLRLLVTSGTAVCGRRHTALSPFYSITFLKRSSGRRDTQGPPWLGQCPERRKRADLPRRSPAGRSLPSNDRPTHG